MSFERGSEELSKRVVPRKHMQAFVSIIGDGSLF